MTKKIYCTMCASDLKIRAEYAMTFKHQGAVYVEVLCNKHMQGRVQVLREYSNITPTVKKINQPIPMLWA